jgi:hypothetical protein
MGRESAKPPQPLAVVAVFIAMISLASPSENGDTFSKVPSATREQKSEGRAPTHGPGKEIFRDTKILLE